MSAVYAILIVLEVFAALFGAWCIMNEDTLIAFEDRLAARIKAKIRKENQK